MASDSEESDSQMSRLRSQKRSLRPRGSQSQSQPQSQPNPPRKSKKNTPAPSTSKSKKPKSKVDSNDDIRAVYQMPREEMISNGIHYCLVMHQTKLPIRRIDLIKIAFANPSENPNIVLKELEDVLEEAFGIHLVGVDENESGRKTSLSFIVVSHFFTLTNYIVLHRDEDTEIQKSLLFMILTSIFMIGRNIGEDAIWKLMSELQLYPKGCSRREELHRYLKNAFIATLYLKLEEVKEGNDDIVKYRYAWGFRAEKEMSKYKILKFAAKFFPEKRPKDFVSQYALVHKCSREIKLLKKDSLREEKSNVTEEGERESADNEKSDSDSETDDPGSSEEQ